MRRWNEASRLWLLPLAVVASTWIFPIVWTAITSLKPEGGLIGLRPTLIFEPTLVSYVELFTDRSFGRYLLNSLAVAGGATIVSMGLASLAAYALARSDLRAGSRSACGSSRSACCHRSRPSFPSI